MRLPILIQVLPFLFLYSLMILAAILIDFVLHTYNLAYIGRYLGLIGTCIILMSFIYSLRKRKIIKIGAPKDLLKMHEYLAWIGSVLILVHAGIHFNALLPWLAILMLLINVASGLVGKFLLKNASLSLGSNRQELIASGMTAIEADRHLFLDNTMVDVMKKWRVIHLPIAFTFGILSLMHIITMLIFSH